MGRDEWISDQTLAIAAAEALRRPEPCAMSDARLYTTHAPVITWVVKGDDLLQESNFRTVTAHLTAVAGEHDEDVIDARINDWAAGPLQQTFVRVRDEHGLFTRTWREAVKVALALRDEYPVFDETDFSSLEFETWVDLVEDEMKWVTSEYEEIDGDMWAKLRELAIGDLQTAGDIEYHGCPHRDVLLGAYAAARNVYYADLGREILGAQIAGQEATL